MDEELETEEVVVTEKDDVVLPVDPTVVEVETIISSTEPAESVIKEYISEDKKQELIARLQSLKTILDEVEERKAQILVEPVAVKPKLNGDKMFNRAQLLSIINADLRANIITFANSDRYDAFKDALEVLAGTTQVYDEIVTQLLEVKID